MENNSNGCFPGMLDKTLKNLEDLNQSTRNEKQHKFNGCFWFP